MTYNTPSLSSGTVANDTAMESQQQTRTFYERVSSAFGHRQMDTMDLLSQKFPGSGTEESPYVITFQPNDPENAMAFPKWKKWSFTGLQAIATLATTFASSAYSGGMKQVIRYFNVSSEVTTLGISLYVLGFALGPLVWAPLSEEFGRRKIFFVSFMAGTAFAAGAAGADSIAALLVLRFLTGSIGSAPLSNAPAVIADMFDKSERGMAMCMFSGAPFLGPAIAFPIVFQGGRGWNQGVGGLAFLGIVVGVALAILTFVYEDKRYAKAGRTRGAPLEPEDRLPPAMMGSVLIPVGLFWFAWTSFNSIHWIVPIIGTVFFAWGLVLVFMALLNYLIDSYVVFAASVMAANSVIRSLFGAAFPLFTKQMYQNLGIHWASSVPAFLALACVPFPFLFFKYGQKIRMKCEYAAEAAVVLEKIRTQDAAITEEDAMEEAEEMWRASRHNSRASRA
ncbi:hypothetical protein ACHAP4_003162 [Fusarium culmorum]